MILMGWIAVRIVANMDQEAVSADEPPFAAAAVVARAESPVWKGVEPRNAGPTKRTIFAAPVGRFAMPYRQYALKVPRQRPPIRPMMPGSAFIAPRAPPPSNDAPASSPAPLALPAPSGMTAIDRWHLGVWLLWRPDGGSARGLTSGGQLGASQAGARLDIDLFPTAKPKVTAYARVSAALVRPAAPEAAIGLSLQPARRLPVSLALERRIALGRDARDAMAVMVVGGFGPAAIAGPLHAEAYAQGGIVGFQARDAFVDGKLSLFTPLPRSALRLGGSVSGGAQPGVHRIDIGPELQVRLPLPAASARLAVEWRERIAGRASPASGIAITLAADF